jgi:undecaprenyl-diphosphatase
MSLLEQILDWDQSLFLAFHDGCSNSIMDTIMPWFRNPKFWIPVYAFLLYFSVKKFGRNGLVWVLALLVVFGLTDFSSASIFKPYFGRLRPCNDPGLQEFIHAVVHCGPGKSFPSSHSSNHFGVSFFIIFTLGRFYNWVKIPAFCWALLVVVAQVYVGVHYPLDILGGVVVGFLSAGLVSFIFQKYVPFQPIKN